MTRTEQSTTTTSWETKSLAPMDDSQRMDSIGQESRPRGRIRRSMTACNTCRKLKTRCDLDPRGHACRRCLSLRFVRWLVLISIFSPFAPSPFLWTAFCLAIFEVFLCHQIHFPLRSSREAPYLTRGPMYLHIDPQVDRHMNAVLKFFLLPRKEN